MQKHSARYANYDAVVDTNERPAEWPCVQDGSGRHEFLQIEQSLWIIWLLLCWPGLGRTSVLSACSKCSMDYSLISLSHTHTQSARLVGTVPRSSGLCTASIRLSVWPRFDQHIQFTCSGSQRLLQAAGRTDNLTSVCVQYPTPCP